jgi:hypothetical protein
MAQQLSIEVPVKNFARDLPGYLEDIDEREEWCLDMNLEFPWIGELSMRDDQSYLVFEFTDSHAATMFKLRWGGSV